MLFLEPPIGKEIDKMTLLARSYHEVTLDRSYGMKQMRY